MVLEELDENLVLYLPFSEGNPDNVTVAKVLDRSSCQNHGTVSGAVIVKPYEDMSNDSDDEGDNPLVVYDDDECYDDETEIMTIDGFKLFKNVTKNDLVLTLNEETGQMEYNYPTKLFAKAYNGVMYKFGGKNHKYDLLVSPRHDHWVREYRHPERGWFKINSVELAKLLDKGRELEFKKDAKWIGQEPKIFSLNGEDFLIEEWLRLTAWYLAEGCPNGKYIINISKRKDKYKNDIRQLLDNLDLSWGENDDVFYIYGKKFNEYFSKFGKANKKYIPEYIKNLSSRLIRIFVEEYCKGDGTGNLIDINTTSSKMRDDLQELILKMGFSSTVHTSDNSCGYGNGDVPLYKITINHKQNTPIISFKYEMIKYDGMIYDITVPNHLIYVRRNGKTVWSGNSFWSTYASGAGGVIATLSEETTIVKKGTSSLKIEAVAGAGAHLVANHDYGADQDWRGYDYVTFWFYGSNTGRSVVLYIYTNAAETNYWRYTFTDNFTGWQRFLVPFERMTAGGSPSLSTVRKIRFYIQNVGLGEIFYIDRTTFDVGNWKFGEAAGFDGVNDTISIALDQSLVPDSFTICAWINTRVLDSAYHEIIRINGATGANYIININTANNLAFAFYDTYASTWREIASSGGLSIYTWHFVVASWDDINKIGRVYLDGKLVISNTIANAVADLATGNLYIGSNAGADRWFDGLIDEIRIYNRVLSPEEIRALYLQVSRRG